MDTHRPLVNRRFEGVVRIWERGEHMRHGSECHPAGVRSHRGIAQGGSLVVPPLICVWSGHRVRLAYNNCSTVIGHDLMRRPVAWCTALAMAADRPTPLIS